MKMCRTGWLQLGALHAGDCDVTASSCSSENMYLGYVFERTFVLIILLRYVEKEMKFRIIQDIQI
jgi:hypothetical protein